MNRRPSIQNIASLSLLFCILAGNAYMLSRLAFRQFPLFDFSAFFDASWRIYRGQQPYVDFFYTTGPIYLYLNALFFLMFGFSKIAFYIQMVTISTGVVVMTYLMTRKKMPAVFALTLSALSASGYYWHFPVPWYDFSAHLWVVLGIYVFSLRIPFATHKTAFWISFFAGTMAVLAFMTKSNIGLACLPAFLLMAAAGKSTRSAAIFGYVSGCVTSLLLITIFFIRNFPAYLHNMAGYGNSSSLQLLRFFVIETWFKNLYWLPALAVLFCVRPFRRKMKEWLTLFLGVGAVGLFSLNTGSLRYRDHLPLMGIYLGLGFIILFHVKNLCRDEKREMIRRFGIATLTLTLLLQLYRTAFIQIRHVVQNFAHDPQGTYALRAPQFKGWLFKQPDGLYVDLITQFVKQNVPKNESLLILSEYQIVYALAGHDSYKKIPFIWHLGVFPAGMMIVETRSNILRNPPDWILTYREKDNPYINSTIKNLQLPLELLSAYELVNHWGEHAIFRKRDLVPIGSSNALRATAIDLSFLQSSQPQTDNRRH